MNPNPSDRIIKSKFNYALTEKMLNILIKKTETAIIIEKEKQSKIIPELQEAEALFKIVKEQYDAHQAIIDEEESTLAALVATKSGDKEREVYHTISNTLQKPKKERSTVAVQWISIMKRLLLEKNHFMPFNTLFDLAGNSEEVRENKVTRERKLAAKYNLKNYIITTNRSKDLKEYKGKIGLAEWFIGDEINPKYLKDFMG